MKYPCKDCPDRHVACHDNCERYQATVKPRDEAQIQADSAVKGYHAYQAKRSMRKKQGILRSKGV